MIKCIFFFKKKDIQLLQTKCIEKGGTMSLYVNGVSACTISNSNSDIYA